MDIQNQIKLGREILAKGDTKRALKIFAEAAKKDPQAFLALSACYEAGEVVAADDRESRRYRELARLGGKKERECRRRAARIFHMRRGPLGVMDEHRISRAHSQALEFARSSENRAMREDYEALRRQRQFKARRLQAERARKGLLARAAGRVLAMCQMHSNEDTAVSELLQVL